MRSMRADQLENLSNLSDIEDQINKKRVELEQSEEISESEFKAWVKNIEQTIEPIKCDMYELKVNTHPESLSDALDVLTNLLKPQLRKDSVSEESIFFFQKMSTELNNHYDCQGIHAHLLVAEVEIRLFWFLAFLNLSIFQLFLISVERILKVLSS